MDAVTMPLEREFKYFVKHQLALVKKYKGKFLVIRGDEVVSVHETEESAYFDAKEKYPLGTFLIQQCIPGKEAYTQVFHSRVF